MTYPNKKKPISIELGDLEDSEEKELRLILCNLSLFYIISTKTDATFLSSVESFYNTQIEELPLDLALVFA